MIKIIKNYFYFKKPCPHCSSEIKTSLLKLWINPIKVFVCKDCNNQYFFNFLEKLTLRFYLQQLLIITFFFILLLVNSLFFTPFIITLVFLLCALQPTFDKLLKKSISKFGKRESDKRLKKDYMIFFVKYLITIISGFLVVIIALMGIEKKYAHILDDNALIQMSKINSTKLILEKNFSRKSHHDENDLALNFATLKKVENHLHEECNKGIAYDCRLYGQILHFEKKDIEAKKYLKNACINGENNSCLEYITYFPKSSINEITPNVLRQCTKMKKRPYACTVFLNKLSNGKQIKILREICLKRKDKKSCTLLLSKDNLQNNKDILKKLCELNDLDSCGILADISEDKQLDKHTFKSKKQRIFAYFNKGIFTPFYNSKDIEQALNWVDKKGHTLLHQAIKFKNKEMTKYLLENNFPINRQCKKGLTALMKASYYKNSNLQIFNNLIKHGAETNSKDKNERSALNFALFPDAKNSEIIQTLIKNKVNLSKKIIKRMINRNDFELLNLFFSIYGRDYIFSILPKNELINYSILYSRESYLEEILKLTNPSDLPDEQKSMAIFKAIMRGDDNIKKVVMSSGINTKLKGSLKLMAKYIQLAHDYNWRSMK